MPRLYCGFDFGTSNTVVTVINETGETLALIADASVLFLPDCGARAQERYVGAEAVERYVQSGMVGRFIQSIKSVLPDPAFRGTEIFEKRYTAEELVAMVLSHFQSAVEQELGVSIDRAVFGRPVKFSDEPERDRLAEERLTAAAERCGFRDVTLEFEPVAAARRFASLVSPGLHALVCDFGGGTSDFSVISVDDQFRIVVPANHGVRVGGDDFDGEIMWHRLIPYFGYGTDYESFGRMLPVPVHIYQALRQWERIAFLKTSQYREDLRYIHSGASDRIAIEWLMKLIDEDLGFALFQAIRDAKHALSDEDSAAVVFFEHGLELKERIYYDEFASYIEGEIANVSKAIERVLRDAELSAGDVRALFLTGGSSFARPLQDRVTGMFPGAQIRLDSDRFNSVSLGLASRAREIGLTIS